MLGARGSLPKVRTVDLRCNFGGEIASDGRGDKAMASFVEGLGDGGGAWRRLAALDFGNCDLRTGAAASLAQAVGRGELPDLVALRLDVNTLLDGGVAELAPPLARLRALKELVLKDNHFSDVGVTALLSAGDDGAGFRALQKLDLRLNAAGVPGLSSLSAAIRTRGAFPALVELKLQGMNPLRLTGEPVGYFEDEHGWMSLNGVDFHPPDAPAEVVAAIKDVQDALSDAKERRLQLESDASQSTPPERAGLNLRLTPQAAAGVLWTDDALRAVNQHGNAAASEPTASVASAPAPVLKSGTLQKRTSGKLSARWVTRSVVVDSENFCYDSKGKQSGDKPAAGGDDDDDEGDDDGGKSKPSRQVLPLRELLRCRLKDVKTWDVFILQHTSRSYEWRAPSASEACDWVECINAAKERATSGTKP